MSLDGALSIAGTGIGAINSNLAVISQNIANANTPSYAAEVSTQQEVTAAGVSEGVRVGLTVRQVDTVLQSNVLGQNATVAGLQTRSAALSAIDSVQGTPGDGSDLASLLGRVQSAFSTLADDPSSSTQQQAVVTAAQTLATGINRLSGAYQQQRQAAQDSIASAIAPINSAIGTIGSLSSQIVALKAAGDSTADLENQRDAAVQTLSQYFPVTLQPQSDGDALLIAGGGLSIPIHAANPFATSDPTIGTTSTYPGGIPAITLNGTDVTAQLAAGGSGQIGAAITLRDTTLPTFQAELDEFSAQLSNRFDAQGLTLFTRPDGSLPTSTGPNVQSGYVGYASEITVNPAVAATPSAVRDGTHNVAGSATGASAFTVNPASGPAGFNTLVTRVLDYALGGQAQAGVAQPAIPTTGLGSSGTLSAPYAAPASVTDLAATLVSAQSAEAGDASTQLTHETSVQTALNAKLASADGVNIDSELALMVQLQNAYGANAKVIGAAQAMYTALFAAIPAA